jgi:hypothetical protein
VGVRNVPKAEILRSPSTGATRRVFKGQRWLVVSQHDEQSPTDLLAFGTRAEADHMVARLHRFGGLVHYVEQADLVEQVQPC